jgi:hypothetical protein
MLYHCFRTPGQAMSKLLPLFLIVCISTVAQAASVYRWVDSDGQIHYSDLPSAGSEAVELRESSVYTPRELPDINREEEAEPTDEGAEPTDEGAGPTDEEAGPTDEEEGQEGAEVVYESLRVVVPENDETVRSNEGEVRVSLELQPGLAQGHKIRIYLDGNKASGELPTTQVTLQNVERGTHSLTVAVVDAAGRELIRSPASTFHLRRLAVLKPLSQ